MLMKEQIIPIPRQFILLGGSPIVLGVPGKVEVCVKSHMNESTVLRCHAKSILYKKLTGLLNDNLDKGSGRVTINLRIADAPESIKNADQGYEITVDNDQVDVCGYGDAGLLFAVTTLIQCLVLENNVLALPRMKIIDWPDFKTRGHFMESRYGSNLMELDDWKHVIDNMAGMKMNQLVISVYGCWCVQYDGRVSEYLYVPLKKYPELKTPVVSRYFSPSINRWIDTELLPPMFEQDFLGDLIAYGKECGVTVFPLFNSFGHNTLIPTTFPEVSAKDETGEPSLSGLCTASEQTYELLFSIYDEIIDRYLLPNGIDCFHLGLDEVCDGIGQNANDIYKVRSPWCKCSICKTKSRKEIYLGHAIKLMNHLKQRGITNIYMYNDMLVDHGISGDANGCEDMYKALADYGLLDTVIIDWWTYSANQEDLTFQTTQPELGLRRTVKPWNGYYHWTVLTNSLPNVALLANMGMKESVEGMQSYSAWDESYDRNHVGQADFSWNYIGTGSVEHVTEHYVNARFAAQYNQAKRAFRLIDWIVEDKKRNYEDGRLAISNYSLLLQLSYYFYSYVSAGKSYPRKFPGEALQAILGRRNETERSLNEIKIMAAEAKALFESIAHDQRCDTRMARRFAYEANHFLTLVDDYLELLTMVDLSASECPDRFARIRDMAGKRKLARLDLMDQLEQTKEPFLYASHLRNHSIFMQYFSDLEGYLANSPEEDIKLDFTDNTHFASKAFMSLR